MALLDFCRHKGTYFCASTILKWWATALSRFGPPRDERCHSTGSSQGVCITRKGKAIHFIGTDSASSSTLFRLWNLGRPGRSVCVTRNVIQVSLHRFSCSCKETG